MVTMRAPWGATVTAPEAAANALQRHGWTPAHSHNDPAPHVGEVGEVGEVGAAPKRQASRAEWAEYAESIGLNVEGLKRDEIISRVREHMD